MLRNNVFNKKQRELLFPPGGPASVTSKSFDITLLYKLFLDFSHLFLEQKISEELLQDLQTIKDYRNEVYAHVPRMEISVEEFERKWKDIKDTLLRIVKFYDSERVLKYEEIMDNLYKAPVEGYPGKPSIPVEIL